MILEITGTEYFKDRVTGEDLTAEDVTERLDLGEKVFLLLGGEPVEVIRPEFSIVEK